MWRSEAPPAPSVGSASASSVGCLVREAGWVLKGPGGARWSAVAASTRVCTRAFVSILLLSNSPRLKTSADLALQFSFLCSLGACYARSPRDLFGGNARLSVFFALQTYKSSPPQPFWEFLSRVPLRWVLMLSPSSPCPLIPFVTSQSCPVTLVLKRYLTIPIQH